MICKNCSTEIAGEALICYRCGTATSEPARQLVELDRTAPRRLVSLLLGLAFILVVGFFMTQMRGGEAPPALVWAMLGVAGALLAWRLWLSR